ncbi:MAG: zf-HC2 domain-containing protein [Vicinamibacteria bacterium]
MSNDCAEAAALVEKLADGEASGAEKREAEAHLEKCSSCRDHLEFLTALGASARELPLARPPDAYWEQLPRKILDRIGAEGPRPGFGQLGQLRKLWQAVLAPGALRWQALGAAILLLATVGVAVLRQNALDPRMPQEEVASEPPPPAPSAPLPEVPSRAPEAESFEPPMARDEQPSEEPAQPTSERPYPGQVTEKAETEEPASAAPAPPVEAFEAVDDRAEPRSVEEFRVSEDRARVARRDVEERASAAANAAALSAESVRKDCGLLRSALSAEGDDARNPDARYELAVCSLREYENDPRVGTLDVAVADSEAFLAVESEGPRADEIREKLTRIR